MRFRLPGKYEIGVTAIELMAVLMIVAILLVIGVPSLNELIDRHRIKSAIDTLHTDLQFARAEAIRSNGRACVGFTSGSNWCYGMNLSTGTTCDGGTCD